MFAEIKKVTQYLLTEKKYIDLRKRILFTILVFFALILIDRFALTRLAQPKRILRFIGPYPYRFSGEPERLRK